MKTKQHNNNNNNQASLLASEGDIQTVRELFSEHFFEYTIKQNSDYRKIGDLHKVREEIGELFREHRNHLERSKSEEDCKQNLIEPILEKLGFGYSREGRIGELKPDYLLFTSSETRKQVQQSVEDHLDRYHHAIGLLEAKPFGRPLGNPLKDGTKYKFPHDQINFYLSHAFNGKGGSWFQWGILTNGKHWRLYCQKTNLDSYFEMDLEQVVTNEKAFRMFWFLFHVSAFVQKANQICRLDEANTDAHQYKTHVEENLKSRIFDILIELANGFYNNPENGIINSKTDMEKLYDTSLIYLYRILFILYAEGRNLLPAKGYGSQESQIYRKFYSLAFLSDELREGILPTHDVMYHDRIQRLFKLIEGKKQDVNLELNVPQYDGGLFDNILRREISNWVIEDGPLIKVLRWLIFIEAPSVRGKTRSIVEKTPIDYSALEIRQLGSIYEGLLEYHLNYDSSQNCLVLKQDNIKRKSTGSYYTPDLIVQYIVEETLTPHLTKISKMPSVVNGEPDSFASEVLKLKVLDPAMGSGHFLVRTTEFLADKIIGDPTTEAIGSHEEQKALWRRRVVESCIYGVDLNPLAVELAKLSLWLTCISSDKPLNFLDHHLRCGNSLIGIKNEDMGILARKGETIHVLSKIEGLDEKLAKAKDALLEITTGDVNSLHDAEKKKQIWDKDVNKLLAPFRAIADLRTSMEFDLNLQAEEYKEIVLALMSAEPKENAKVSIPLKLRKKYKDAWKTHLKNVIKHRPFHWELEFPDVFIKDGDEKGFDVVIGNPPYVQLQKDEGRLAEIYKYCGFETFERTGDIYTLFYEKGIKLLRLGGHLGYITSNKWMRTAYGKSTRMFLNKYNPIQLIDLGPGIFESATVDTNVLLIQNAPNKNDLSGVVLTPQVKDIGLSDFVHNNGNKLPRMGEPILFIGSQAELSLKEKIGSLGKPLKDWEVKINFGIKTGFNKAFIINTSTKERLCKEDPKSAEILKPILRGRDIMRYGYRWDGLWIIASEYDIDIPKRYNGIYRHLLKYDAKAKKRDDQGQNWWNLRSCTYYNEFAKNKLVWKRIGSVLRFGYDDAGMYCQDSTCIMTGERLKYICAFLNSKLGNKLLFDSAPKTGTGDVITSVQALKPIMIPKITSANTPIVEKLEDLSDRAISEQKKYGSIEQIEKEIDFLIYQLYDLTDEEIAIVEGRNKRD